MNVVAPEAVSQAGFARAVAHANKAALRLRIPAALIQSVAGDAATLLLDGQAATPRRLLATGFRFKHPGLQGALASLRHADASASPGMPAPASAALVQ